MKYIMIAMLSSGIEKITDELCALHGIEVQKIYNSLAFSVI